MVYNCKRKQQKKDKRTDNESFLHINKYLVKVFVVDVSGVWQV